MSHERYPLVRVKEGIHGEAVYTHPAMGTVRVSQHSGYRKLFGSDIEHHRTICMTFEGATYRRSLSNDWIHGDNHMHLEVHFSPLQWAEMISSMGLQSTPVTYGFTTRDGVIGDLPDYKEAHTDLFKGEVKERTDRTTAKVGQAHDALLALKKQSSVRKSDLDAVIGLLAAANQDMRSNVPFVLEQFEERTEQIVNDAKAQVTAHVTGLAQRLGQQALAERLGTGEVKVTALEHRVLEGGKE